MKDIVASEFSTSIDQICLIYSGKILKDDEDLKKHGMWQMKLTLQILNVWSIDIKDGVTIHLVIRAPKSDATASTTTTTTSTTSSETSAEVRIRIVSMEFDGKILASSSESSR